MTLNVRKLLMLLLVCAVLLPGGSAFAAGPGNNSSPNTEAELQSEIEFRKSLGFRSDPDYVRSVHAAPDAVTFEAMGATFTPAEAKELTVRLELERDGETLQRHFAENPNLQDAFGGIYLDHVAGGELVLQLVREHAMAGQIPAMLPHLQHPTRLRTEHVDWPESHLKQQFDLISNAITTHPELQAVAVLIDQPANRVVLTIKPSGRSATSTGAIDKVTLPADLGALVADPSIIVEEGVIEETPTAVVAGLSWGDDWKASRCTLGFEVIYSNTPSMVTAGHCVDTLPRGATIYQNGTSIGNFSGAWVNGSTLSTGYGIDGAVHFLKSAATATDNIYPNIDVTGAVSTSSYVKGYTLCFYGMSSGTNVCGTITIGTLTYQNPDNGRWYNDMYTIDPTGSGGDSGGPGYRANTSTTASAAGILRGNLSYSGYYGSTNGSDTVFSKWHNVAGYFGLTLVTTD